MSPAEQPAAGAAPAATTAEAAKTVSLADMVAATPQTEPDRAKDMIRALVDEVTRGTVTWDKNVVKSIKDGIAAIDQKLSKQLAQILHNPTFQKLEASWRGLNYLVKKSETGTQLKIKVLNVSKDELYKDLEEAADVDGSQLFQKIYGNEFDQPGGQPFGALIGDYEFGKHPNDVFMLDKIAGVAAMGFCPFISAAAPDLMNLTNWRELSRIRDLAKTFEGPEHTKWRSFRESEDSRYVALVMPRVLSRLPYGAGTQPIKEFAFEEVELEATGEAKPVPHEHYAWMNAAYALGTKLTDAFAKFGWCTAIRGVEGGGKVEDLPTHVYKSEDGDLDLKCPSEIPIGDRREKELSDCGFLPICHFKGTDYAVFFGAQTTQQPTKYDRAPANDSAQLSARLPYIMAASRIAHYLKVIARDKIGSFMEASDCEAWLNRWINNYVNTNPDAGQESKARYPLAAARIDVATIPGKPGSYRAQAFLRPWLQFEELTTALSLVTEIPKE